MRRIASLLAAWLVSGMAIAQSPPAAAPDPQADKTEEDAVFVELMLIQFESWRHDCAAALPEEALAMASITVRWISANREEILGSRAVEYDRKREPNSHAELLKFLDSTAVASFVESTGKAKRDLCLDMFKRLSSGDSDFAREFPETSKSMRDFLTSHPLSRDRQRAYSNPIGCLKSIVNNGLKAAGVSISYETGVQICQCAYEGASEALTPEQWTEFEDSVGKISAVEARSAPQMQLISRAAQNCITKYTAR